jgi:hypothetical protein
MTTGNIQAQSGLERSKHNLTIRELNMQTEPTNKTSPIIKRKFKPLDDPSNLIDVLQGILIIKEGVIENKVTTGPSQSWHWRGCLTGTELDKFNKFIQAVGNKTAANLIQVGNNLSASLHPAKFSDNRQVA